MCPGTLTGVPEPDASSQPAIEVRSALETDLLLSTSRLRDLETHVARLNRQASARTLDDALQRITDRYGKPTSDFVAMQLEYPRRPMPLRRD